MSADESASADRAARLLERRVEILEIGQAHLTRQQAETAVALRDIASCLQQGTATMSTVQTELQANTKTTSEVRTILDTAKGGLRFLGILGAVIKWGAVIGGAITSLIVTWHTIKNGGKPPGL